MGTRKTFRHRQTLRQTARQTLRQTARRTDGYECLLSQIIEQSQCMTRCRPFVEILSIYSTNSRAVYGLPCIRSLFSRPTLSRCFSSSIVFLHSVFQSSPTPFLSHLSVHPSLPPSLPLFPSPRAKFQIEERKREQFLVSKQTILNRGERRTMLCV